MNRIKRINLFKIAYLHIISSKELSLVFLFFLILQATKLGIAHSVIPTGRMQLVNFVLCQPWCWLKAWWSWSFDFSGLSGFFIFVLPCFHDLLFVVPYTLICNNCFFGGLCQRIELLLLYVFFSSEYYNASSLIK